MRNHEVTQKHNLLDSNGRLIEPGWSKTLIQTYSREQIKKRKTRIKEWDYYYIMSNSNDFCLCLTISDLGYLGMYSVSFVDLKNAVEHTQSVLTAFPLGKTNFTFYSWGNNKNSQLGRDNKIIYQFEPMPAEYINNLQKQKP